MPNELPFSRTSFQTRGASVAAKENFDPVFARVTGPRDPDVSLPRDQTARSDCAPAIPSLSQKDSEKVRRRAGLEWPDRHTDRFDLQTARPQYPGPVIPAGAIAARRNRRRSATRSRPGETSRRSIR